jgi:hypothetical protein
MWSMRLGEMNLKFEFCHQNEIGPLFVAVPQCRSSLLSRYLNLLRLHTKLPGDLRWVVLGSLSKLARSTEFVSCKPIPV